MTTQSDFAELLQKSEELNLKYKMKIIELQNDLNHERSKAKEYQNKFKDAVMQSVFSEGQGLLEKLDSKQEELYECRTQIIELNRRLANTANSPSQNDLMALAHENEELMANIEEIKEAAINAIMMKEEQIQELNKNISQFENMENELKFQYQKYQSLQRQFQQCMAEKADEIRELSEKLTKERQVFLNKLELIQKESYQQENYKVKLEEKTQDLQGTIEKSEMLIADYENKIYELETQIHQQRIATQQERAKFEIQVEQLKEEVKNYERQERNLNKALEDLKNKWRNAAETISKLNQKNEDLNHRLSLKKKKESKVIKDKIRNSFAGVAKGNPVYASFAFRAKDSIAQQQEDPKHLGDVPQLQDVEGFIENFNFDDLGKGKAEEIPNDVPISHMMTKKKKNNVIEVVEVGKAQPVKAQTQPTQPIQHVPNAETAKEIENYKHTLLRVEAQKKQLQISLTDAYNQMQQLNKKINSMSSELQQQRKNIAELRQQMKKTKKQAELLVQVQSLTLHVQKLQMDMITSKLKYAEEADFAKEKYGRERIMWTQKLVQLTNQIAKQDLQISPAKTEEKKKKKGFFG